MKILILGGGLQQLPAIRKAHEMGLEIIVADYLERPPGKAESDRFYRISTRDKEQILELARQEEVDGVLAFASDPAAETAAYAAEQLGLSGGYTRAAEVLGHKRCFREFLSEHELPVPGHVGLTKKTDKEAGLECMQSTLSILHGMLRYPLLIKPADSSGSKGVTVLQKPDHIKLLAAYQKAVSYAYRGDVLAEEYISYGYPHLIGGDVILRNGEIVCLGLMDCIRETEHSLVPCGKIWPCGADDAIRSRIAEIVTLTARELCILDAELNVEFIAGEDGTIYPIEIALRCGGNGIPQLLSDATGVDWIREEVQRTLRAGQQDGTIYTAHSVDEQKTSDAFAAYNLHADSDGLYAGYELAEELARHLYREELFCQKGDAVKPYADASGIIGILYFRFGSREEAERYLYDMPQYLHIHVITIERISKVAVSTTGAAIESETSSAETAISVGSVVPIENVRETKAHFGGGTTHNIQDEILHLGEHMTPPFSHRDQNGWGSAEYARKLTEHAEIFTARNAEGKIIGLIAAYMNQLEQAYISMLVISPEYRRCRIAQALCQNVHELARQRGIRCVRGEIRRENAACRAMAVKQLGYTEQDIDGSEYVRVEKLLASEQ